MTTVAAEWNELLTRRPAFREALAPAGRLIEAWASWPGEWLAPFECTAQEARRHWSNGEPLLAHAAPAIPPEQIEPLLHHALDVIDATENTSAFAQAWDHGDVGPASLLPVAGHIGTAEVAERCRLTKDAVALLGVAGLRPALCAWFAGARTFVEDGLWDRGTCACCGAPPGFADLLEDGRRRLACHLCDTHWTFARLMCPFCDSRESADVVRLIAEGADEGYAISACRACRGYIKEVDRRARWNAAASPLVEDWGSPHLDLVAERQGFWRAVPTMTPVRAEVSRDAR